MSAKCIKRLQQEFKDMKSNKAANAEAAPDEDDLLTWYFVLDGPEGTPYSGGEYLGRIKFPNNYPFAPPSYFVCTPNGRFQTETSICTSFSSYHSDQWTPAWNVSTILQGLLSFMVENATTAGSITTDEETKKSLAKSSHSFNVRHSRYKVLFPERFEKASSKLELEKKEKEERENEQNSANDGADNNDEEKANNSTNGEIKKQTNDDVFEKKKKTTTAANNNNNGNNNQGGFDKKYAYLLLGIAAGAALVAKFL